MESRTKTEWLEWYEERTGCGDLELYPNEQVFFHPEHGFITYFIVDDILELHHMCGDGKAWQKLLIEIMKQNGLKKLRAFTMRNPEAWMRKYGGHIRGYYMEAGLDEMKE